MSISEFMKKSLNEGSATVLSSSVSVSAFSFFSEQKDVKWNFIFQKIPSYKSQHFAIDLLEQDSTINAAFFRQYHLKKAIEFLKRSDVELGYLKAGSRCSANMLYFCSDSAEKKGFVFRSDLPFSDKTLADDFPALELPVIIEHDKSDSKYSSGLTRYTNALEELKRDHVEYNLNINNKRISLKDHMIKALEQMLVKYTPGQIYNHMLLNIYSKHLDLIGNLDDIAYYRDTMICRHLHDYQKVAVSQLIRNIENHNGAMLADAVGLGKTWTALGVIKYYMMQGFKVCVIVPNSVKADWEQYLGGNGSCLDRDDFRFDLKTHTDLGTPRFAENDPYFRNRIEDPENNYLFIVDESHNFRTNNKRTKMLRECLEHHRNKTKVLLLTATPINLKVPDLKAQFNLIARGKKDAFADSMQIPNFHTVIDNTSKTIKENLNGNATISELNNQIGEDFKRLVSSLVVARTKQQLIAAGIQINTPKANPAVTEQLDQLDQGTMKIDKFDEALPKHLTCYSPDFYCEELKNEFENKALRTVHLRGMLVSGIVKRLESSWNSCKLSLENILSSHKALESYLKNYDNKNLDDVKDIAEDDIDGAELPGKITWETIEKIKNNGKLEEFKTDLADDIGRLTKLVAMFQCFSPENDKKLQRLIAAVEERFAKPKNNGRKKILIFTTYEDTAEYLFTELSKKFSKVGMISGGSKSADRRDTLDRFAPYTRLYRSYDWNRDFNSYDDWREWIKQQGTRHAERCQNILNNELEILIATDCLSEGTNLQDADFIVNYDIHWNPVRLLQRLGRINRVNSPNSEVDALNFMPSEGIEEHLKLIKRIKDRIKTAAGTGTNVEVPIAAAPDEDTAEQLKDWEDCIGSEEIVNEITQIAVNWDVANTANTNGENVNLYDLPQDAAFMDALDIRNYSERTLPYGIFSGVQSEDGAGFIFLVKKKICDDNTNPYRFIHVVKNAKGEFELKDSDFKTVLNLMKGYSSLERYVSKKLANLDPDYLLSVADTLKKQLFTELKHADDAAAIMQMLQGIMPGDSSSEKSNANNENEYDLISWLEVNVEKGEL